MTETKLAVVTAANSGLGLPLSVSLARAGYDLVFLNRSRERSSAVEAAVKSARPGLNVETVVGDLADHDSLRSAAGAILSKHAKIHALFNNAGVLVGDLEMSKQGNELHFEVNTLAPYQLIRLLRPALAAANGARVLSVGSSAMFLAGELRIDELRRPPGIKKLVGAYGQSKLALAVLNQAIAPELTSDKIIVRVGEPGPNKTTMTSASGMPGILLLLRPFLMSPPDVGAKKLFDAAFAQRLGDKTGIYVEKGDKIRSLPKNAADPAVLARLVSLAKELTRL